LALIYNCNSFNLLRFDIANFASYNCFGFITTCEFFVAHQTVSCDHEGSPLCIEALAAYMMPC